MGKTPEDYRSRWWSVLYETIGMIGLQMISNLLLLGPVFVTTYKVTEKHVALRDNIGTYEEEDKAYDLLTWLSWHLPVFVVASALLDLLLGFVYLKWLHPWKIILQEEEIEDALEMELLLNSNQEREEATDVDMAVLSDTPIQENREEVDPDGVSTERVAP